MHRDGAQAQPLRGPDDPAGDLAAVGDEHGLEHGWLASPSEVGRQARLTGVVLVLVVAVGGPGRVGGHRRVTADAVRVRAVRLLVAAAVVQLGTSALAPGSGLARGAALVLTTVLVGLFLVGNAPAARRTARSALGLLLNVVVIGANAAMPVSRRRRGAGRHLARPTSGWPEDAMRERRPARTPAWPSSATWCRWRCRGWPQVVSPGDVLVAAGVGLLLLTAGARRPQTPRRAVRSTVLESDSTTVGSYS